MRTVFMAVFIAATVIVVIAAGFGVSVLVTNRGKSPQDQRSVPIDGTGALCGGAIFGGLMVITALITGSFTAAQFTNLVPYCSVFGITTGTITFMLPKTRVAAYLLAGALGAIAALSGPIP